MHKPPSAAGAILDLATADRELRAQHDYERDGYAGRTLTREPQLRIVLIAMQAKARIAEHHTKQAVSIHAITGQVRLHVPDGAVELEAGQLLVLRPGLAHDVEAVVDSSFLLTLGWQGGPSP